METYENKIAIESCVKTIHKQQSTEHKVRSMINELEMAYDKAKVFDEINIILDEYLGDVEDELNALNLIREKLEGMEDE